jgi:NAD(P)H-hydrate epimerase
MAYVPIIPGSEMQRIEAAAFARGTAEEPLMDAAGAGLAGVIAASAPQPGQLAIWAGKGHNAGDAFVAAAILAQQGWRIFCQCLFPETEFRPLALAKWRHLQSVAAIHPIDALDAAPHTVLLDGILGIGATGPLSGSIATACQQMNTLRQKMRATTIAVDLPTGLNANTGTVDPATVMADATATFGMPKTGLVSDAATAFVGRIHHVPLPELTPEISGVDQLITDATVRAILPPQRPFEFHKGQAGRIGLIAGNLGTMGAARLCSAAALATGGGLITLFVPDDPASLYQIAATACPPEIMVRTWRDVPHANVDAWGIGPGMGFNFPAPMLETLLQTNRPVVLDADALTVLASGRMELLQNPPSPRLLTPHPGEMARLFPSEGRSRAETARDFTQQYPVTLLLKGSRSLIAQAGHPHAYNSSGTPAMASGGMGDVLTGICATLMAQGIAPYHAAAAGSYLLGAAAEAATKEGCSFVSASQVVARLGAVDLWW